MFARAAARAGVVAGLVLLVHVQAQAQVCVGDCDSDRRVSISELTAMVGGILAGAPASCPPPCSGAGCVADLVAAVHFALVGCPARQADGAACAVAADCRSDDCRQRCCGQACAPGQCCDTGGACVAAEACDHALAPGAACDLDSQCASGVCDPFDVICCIRRCDTATEYCTRDGRCREFGLRIANGQPCDSDFDCQSGRCDAIDRTCCNRRCDPLREACQSGRCVLVHPRPPHLLPAQTMVDSLNSVD